MGQNSLLVIRKMVTMLLYLFGPLEITIGSERFELRSPHVIFKFFFLRIQMDTGLINRVVSRYQMLIKARVTSFFFQLYEFSKTHYKQRQYGCTDC